MQKIITSEIKMKRILLLTSFFLLNLFIVSVRAAPPYKLYNHSSKPWRVSISSLHTIGVYRHLKQINKNDSIIVVNPQESVPLNYPISERCEPDTSCRVSLNEGMKVFITDFEGKSQCYIVRSQWFSSEAAYIRHNGNTGPVVLNGMGEAGQDGDIDIIGEAWANDKQDFGATC
ncbi:MAG: hypothetical protein K0R24_1576 [Gammaproteobacteria bacterium]|jgi:hypothetical protein|nr:hypothetical protein [Gammaproteobacteria bacterium]